MLGGIPTKDNFKPRYKAGYLPLPASFMRNIPSSNRRPLLIIAAIVLLWLLNFTFFSGSKGSAGHYKSAHGIYEHEVGTKSKLIFPPIEHAPLLSELTVSNLFITKKVREGDRDKFRFFYDQDDQESKNEINDVQTEEDHLVRAKEFFKNHGKQVYVGSENPQVIIVTAVDFEKYELTSLKYIVQNRVNYANSQKYGIYVRWVQEFLPLLQQYNNDKEWVRLMVMRAAMHAFPNAKYFWYLDQDALIMRKDINLEEYMLNSEVLDPIMLRDQPIIPPNGAIKTYKNSKAAHARLIITQSETKLDTNSFILVNDIYGKGLLEFWQDPLYRKYGNFPYRQDSALTHILQWHPVLLARTAIVPPRTINALSTTVELSDAGDRIHYTEGDLVVSFRDCANIGTCGKDLEFYYTKNNP